MSDSSALFHKISSDEVMKHIGEDVQAVYVWDKNFKTCICTVKPGFCGSVELIGGHGVKDITGSLEEFLLRAHIAGEKCVWKIDTTNADVMRYGDELYTRTPGHASFFCDFQLPCGFNLLEKGVDVYEA